MRRTMRWKSTPDDQVGILFFKSSLVLYFITLPFSLLTRALRALLIKPSVEVLLHLLIINVVICSYRRCVTLYWTEVMRPAMTKNYLCTRCTYSGLEIYELKSSLSHGYKVMINKYYLSHPQSFSLSLIEPQTKRGRSKSDFWSSPASLTTQI